MSKKYGVKNFLHIANDYINPDLTKLDGIQRWLMGWFAYTYKTTLNDDKLVDMTIEELLVLYNMHRIKDDPNYYEEQTVESSENYEDWLKKEMGESYLTDNEMVEGMQEEELKHSKKLKEYIKTLPSKVTTDFSQFNEDEE